MAGLKEIGDVRIFAELHRGATASVYKGYQSSLDRTVLVKILNPDLAADPGLTASFQQEAKLVAKIHHPNVIALHNFGVADGLAYFTAEFVDGCNLRTLLDQHGTLPSELAWFIMRETSQGLLAAHEAGILHRDIKPENILVSHDGEVKLGDFGLASSQHAPEPMTDSTVGTFAYLSPEEVLGGEVDKGSDIFALGATLYEMLCGVRAFSAADTNECFKNIVEKDPLPYLRRQTSIPPGLSELCGKMLEKKSSQRYSDCRALLDGLNMAQERHALQASSGDLRQFVAATESYTLKSWTDAHQTTQGSDLAEAELPAQDSARQKTQAHAADGIAKPAGRRTLTAALSLAAAVVAMTWLGWGQIFENEPPLKATEKPSGVFTNSEVDTIRQNPAHSKNPTAGSKVPASTKQESETHSRTVPHDKNTPVTKHNAARRLPDHGYLNIACTPWAALFIDGDSIGVTPITDSLKLALGQHRLLLRNPQFPDFSQAVDIQAGRLEKLNISLWSVVGKLNLNVSPWAEIFVDGIYKDTVPPQKQPIVVSPGVHELTLKHPALGQWRTEINITAKQELNLEFNLRNLLGR